MCGTPIGLPGPPHVPLGMPAGLQKHTMVNHTHVSLPEPTHEDRDRREAGAGLQLSGAAQPRPHRGTDFLPVPRQGVRATAEPCEPNGVRPGRAGRMPANWCLCSGEDSARQVTPGDGRQRTFSPKTTRDNGPQAPLAGNRWDAFAKARCRQGDDGDALLSGTGRPWSRPSSPAFTIWHQGVMPPGAIGSRQLQRGGPLPGFFQPVEIKAPPGVLISLASGDQFGPAAAGPASRGAADRLGLPASRHEHFHSRRPRAWKSSRPSRSSTGSTPRRASKSASPFPSRLTRKT